MWVMPLESRQFISTFTNPNNICQQGGVWARPGVDGAETAEAPRGQISDSRYVGKGARKKKSRSPYTPR